MKNADMPAMPKSAADIYAALDAAEDPLQYAISVLSGKSDALLAALEVQP